jgi:inorganic phosphate transporter, PiT family
MLNISLLNMITLPLIGTVDLSSGILLIFFICLLAVIGFEFVNGFHDTANAVATVIYTKALKPNLAVPWSGFWNFMGVNVGGVAVAMGILKLLPLNELMAAPVQVGACLVLGVLLTSIIWNLSTWYLGIPCSSSHTLIGAMIGGSMAFTHFYPGSVNWDKAKDIGESLILSPLFGFGVAALLLMFLKKFVKSEKLFHIPQNDTEKPSFFVRLLLIITCTLVSFFHGSNDGQKGVGLLMLILIAFLPATFAIDHNIPNDKMATSLTNTQQVINRALVANPGNKDFLKLDTLVSKALGDLSFNVTNDAKGTFKYRKDIQALNKNLKAVVSNSQVRIPEADKATLKTASDDLTKITDFSPLWVIITISLSLGLGTMIGWKRIVVTIGEKIGKEHLSYAQGATSEIVAACTIGLSSWFGAPVSTTHVLSSGIAGSMVATGGSKNLQGGTIKNIAMAWVLTLPVCIALAYICINHKTDFQKNWV